MHRLKVLYKVSHDTISEKETLKHPELFTVAFTKSFMVV